jgi:hypothetical protein
VRAVAYPKNGVPRVLQGAADQDSLAHGTYALVLHANAGGSIQPPVRYVDSNSGDNKNGDGSQAKPFKTVYRAFQNIQEGAADGSTTALNGAKVYLQPGDYEWGQGGVGPYPKNTEHWVTVEPAPGVKREDVRFTKSDSWGVYATYIRLHNVTVSGPVELTTNIGPGTKYLWADKVTFAGPGRQSGVYPYRGQDYWGVFVTQSTIDGYVNGPIISTMVRDVQVSNILSDAFTNTAMVVNSKVDGIDASGTEAHSDVWQLFGPTPSQNLILYGVKATNAEAQGLFVGSSSPVKDVACVNVHIQRPNGVVLSNAPFSQWGSPTSHLLLWNCSLPNSGTMWRTAQTSNVSVEGCVFGKLFSIVENTNPFATMRFAHNHFVDTQTFASARPGEDVTTGDPGFVDQSKADIRPAEGSVLKNRITAPRVPVDLLGAARSAPDSVGAVR